jgi:hypothetical protein
MRRPHFISTNAMIQGLVISHEKGHQNYHSTITILTVYTRYARLHFHCPLTAASCGNQSIRLFAHSVDSCSPNTAIAELTVKSYIFSAGFIEQWQQPKTWQKYNNMSSCFIRNDERFSTVPRKLHRYLAHYQRQNPRPDDVRQHHSYCNNSSKVIGNYQLIRL